MIASRRINRNNLEKLNLERKVDQFIEVSRQLVDGVSGTRPGKRRSDFINQSPRKHVKNVTNWVSNKVDSFFEEQDEYEDDWSDQLEKETQEDIKTFNRLEKANSDLYKIKKKPLTAISLRQSEDIPANTNPKQLKASKEEWPEAEDFQISRWKRSPIQSEPFDLSANSEVKINGKTRNLPKSSRRRI